MPARARLLERIGARICINGLGLDENLKAIKVKDGLWLRATDVEAPNVSS